MAELFFCSATQKRCNFQQSCPGVIDLWSSFPENTTDLYSACMCVKPSNKNLGILLNVVTFKAGVISDNFAILCAII